MTPDKLEMANKLATEIENFNSILLSLARNPSLGIIASGVGIHSALSEGARIKITDLVKEDLQSVLTEMESDFKSL